MYSVLSRDGDVEYGINEYTCDTEEDLKNLPKCGMGSSALVINTGEVYVKGGDAEWHKI
jgi:hypothetical protein